MNASDGIKILNYHHPMLGFFSCDVFWYASLSKCHVLEFNLISCLVSLITSSPSSAINIPLWSMAVIWKFHQASLSHYIFTQFTLYSYSIAKFKDSSPLCVIMIIISRLEFLLSHEFPVKCLHVISYSCQLFQSFTRFPA